MGCRGYVAWVAEDMLQGLPRICCMGCRGYVDRGKTKSTPSPSFGLEFDKTKFILNTLLNNLYRISGYYWISNRSWFQIHKNKIFCNHRRNFKTRCYPCVSSTAHIGLPRVDSIIDSSSSTVCTEKCYFITSLSIVLLPSTPPSASLAHISP